MTTVERKGEREGGRHKKEYRETKREKRAERTSRGFVMLYEGYCVCMYGLK